MSSRLTANTSPPSAFEQQRAALISEITMSLEQVLQNLNKLNRSLEGVIDVGKEFGAVEALWSRFEGVMAKEENEVREDTEEEGASGEEAE